MILGSPKSISDRLLEKFFDGVNHDKLRGQIAQRVTDKRLLQLIRAFLTAGVMEDGLVSPVDEGTPQGGPLSPLLSNLVLDEWDHVRSRRAGDRVMASVTRYLALKLKLTANQQKSPVARPWERKFLCFSFTWHRQPKRRIAPQASVRCKERIRELTSRTRGVGIAQMVEELSRYLRAWLGYFCRCQTPSVLRRLEEWTRRRLRSVIWKQWKRSRVRFTELRRRGVGVELAAQTVGSSHGPWRMANSPALALSLSNAYFNSLGIPSLTGGQ